MCIRDRDYGESSGGSIFGYSYIEGRDDHSHGGAGDVWGGDPADEPVRDAGAV